jgi:hypothetical protein
MGISIKDMKGRRPKNSRHLVDKKERSLNSSQCKLQYRQDHALPIAQAMISAALEHNVDSKLTKKERHGHFVMSRKMFQVKLAYRFCGRFPAALIIAAISP